MTPLDLIKFGTYNAEILAFLWLVIEHRRSLIIAGGTASGKTSTMNAISLFIPLIRQLCHWRIPGNPTSPQELAGYPDP